MNEPDRIKGADNWLSTVRSAMTSGRPLATAGGALLNWWKAATLDALLVGVLWLIGLELLHVPLAPLWAALAVLTQFVPALRCWPLPSPSAAHGTSVRSNDVYFDLLHQFWWPHS